MKYPFIIITSLLLASLSGCASITGSTTQTISLQARAPDGKEVKEAQCDLINKRGTYFVSTPGTIQISRSNDDIQVTCRKDGYDNGRAAVVSATKGSMFGNILLGGGIGLIVDHSNGSAYEYPSFVQVIMGSNVTIGTPKETSSAQSANPLTGSQGNATAKSAVNKSSSIRLQELKKLMDDGLITKEVYDQRQTAILQESN